MKKIFTGKGYISVLTLLAIWSLSLVVNLPGLAISPIISVLGNVFSSTTHLESQLLEILPNFFILPFILLSGKLSMSRDKVGLVALGLAIFLASGIAYFFVDSIWGLIIVSCTLGMGCGLVIPLAAGLLAETFTGKYRLEQMGIKSGIANFTLIIATIVVGLTEGHNWHLPFVVYLVPVIPLVMSVFLTQRFLKNDGSADSINSTLHTPTKASTLPRKVVRKRIWGLISFYFVVSVSAVVVSFFIPFMMSSHHMGDSATGYVTATFFLMVTIPGVCLGRIVESLKAMTVPVSIAAMIAGPLIIAFVPALAAYFIGVALIGFGYGVLQPILYDKAAELAPSAANSTRVLSYIMSANYFGVAVCPLFFAKVNSDTAFILSGIIMVVMLVLAIVKRKSFTFSIDDELAAYATAPGKSK